MLSFNYLFFQIKRLRIFIAANSDQYGAEIAIHPNKPYLYASNRGHGPLIVYEISQNGSLLQKQVRDLIILIN